MISHNTQAKPPILPRLPLGTFLLTGLRTQSNRLSTQSNRFAHRFAHRLPRVFLGYSEAVPPLTGYKQRKNQYGPRSSSFGVLQGLPRAQSHGSCFKTPTPNGPPCGSLAASAKPHGPPGSSLAASAMPHRQGCGAKRPNAAASPRLLRLQRPTARRVDRRQRPHKGTARRVERHAQNPITPIPLQIVPMISTTTTEMFFVWLDKVKCRRPRRRRLPRLRGARWPPPPGNGAS